MCHGAEGKPVCVAPASHRVCRGHVGVAPRGIRELRDSEAAPLECAEFSSRAVRCKTIILGCDFTRGLCKHLAKTACNRCSKEFVVLHPSHASLGNEIGTVLTSIPCRVCESFDRVGVSQVLAGADGIGLSLLDSSRYEHATACSTRGLRGLE